MKKWMIGVLVAVGAIVIGVGGAYAFNRAYPLQQNTTAREFGQRGQFRNYFGNQMPGMFNQGPNRKWSNPVSPSGPGFQNGWGGGMMGGQTNQAPANNNQQRITLDQAVTNAETYLKNQGDSIKVAEVMEFQDNFYVAVTETATGRDALELLVDPISGRVSPEIGPNMMWNLKYGAMRMMRSTTASDSTLTEAEARTKAQDALTAAGASGTLNEGGFSFYGYYTFDYSVDGKIAGMLSVNGLNGQVMFHTWYGQFIDEKEF